jgi:hypothetical protein
MGIAHMSGSIKTVTHPLDRTSDIGVKIESCK